jgi:ferric-dicitrate binding protein FerR (iron transport regulator)
MAMLLAVLGLTAVGAEPPPEALARIAKVKGTVHVLAEDSIRKEEAQTGRKLAVGDQVMTLDNGRAVVAFKDGSRVVLDADTKLRLKEGREVGQGQGQAYYEVAKRGAKGFQVRTGFAVIGVKGTRFLVRDQGQKGAGAQAVAMREGRVGVEALKGEFELYKRKQRAAFERFKKQRRQEFEEYKQQQREEFVGYVRSFELEGGRAVTFDGQKAVSEEVSEELESDMDRLEQML